MLEVKNYVKNIFSTVKLQMLVFIYPFQITNMLFKFKTAETVTLNELQSYDPNKRLTEDT